MKPIPAILKSFLPLALIVTALCGLAYLVFQQMGRQQANDPQIQMAEDAASALAQGADPETLLPTGPVDLAASLAPFLIIYDDQGAPLVASARLSGAAPTLPAGVLDYTRSHGEDRVTWQPTPGVRVAAVVTRFAGDRPGFVLAGRSLHEVEKRTAQFQATVGVAWLVTLAALLALNSALELLIPARRPSAS